MKFYSKAHRIAALAKEQGYTVDANTGTVMGLRGKPRKLMNNQRGQGYLTFGVTDDQELRPTGYGKTFPLPVHKFVAYLKYGDSAFAPAVDVRHKNNDVKDNHEANLLLGSRSDNMRDLPAAWRIANAKRAAKARYGIPNESRRKLTDAEVLAVRQRAGRGELHRVLAVEFGLSRGALSLVVAGRRYKSIPLQEAA